MNPKTRSLLLAVGVASIGSTHAALILAYDSLLPASGGSADGLSRIDSQTDVALVASSDVINTIGNRGTLAAIHNSQTNVQGSFGDQNDLLFRFGNSNTTPGNGTLNGAINPGHVGLGPFVAFNYTAATDQTLDQFSAQLQGNSNNGSSYGARDSGLFVSVNGSAFTQFGALDLRGGSGNFGTVTYTDSVALAAGDVVDIRLGFSDRTRTNNDLQAATRIGDVQIFATPVPEPSSVLLLGLAGISLISKRRR